MTLMTSYKKMSEATEIPSNDINDDISDDIITKSLLLWTLVPAIFIVLVLFIYFYLDRKKKQQVDAII